MSEHRRDEVNDSVYEMNMRDYVHEFCNETSLHGARFLLNRVKLNRLVWSAMLLAMFVFSFYCIVDATTEFYSRPFSTIITSQRPKDNLLDFPAVTICNLNKVSTKEYIKTQRSLGFNKSDQEYDIEIKDTIAAMQSTLEQRNKSKNLTEIMKNIELSPGYSDPGPALMQSIRNYSHTIEGMLSLEWLEPCIWRGEKCSAANFTSFVNLKMGQCYTFNSGDEGHERLKSYIAGPSNGLRLRLNVEQDDHVYEKFSLINGFKVSIQSQDVYPTVEEFGFALQPGTHTFAAIRPKNIINLPFPYLTNCSSPSIDLASINNKSYSEFVCSVHCFRQYIIDKCRCQPLFKSKGAFELCSVKNAFECVFPKLHERRPKSVRDCTAQCPEPCTKTIYETKLSYAKAVGPDVFTIKKDSSKDFSKMKETQREEYIRKNVVSLDVYFEEIKFEKIEQIKTLNSVQLLARIGGYLGLFLGMSFLTIIEFLDFIIFGILKLLFGSKKTKPRTAVVSPTVNAW